MTYAKSITSTWTWCKNGLQLQCTFPWPGDRSLCELREYLEASRHGQSSNDQSVAHLACSLTNKRHPYYSDKCPLSSLSDTRSFCRQGTIDSVWKHVTTCHSVFGWQGQDGLTHMLYKLVWYANDCDSLVVMLKKQFIPKWKFCHCLSTFMSPRTCGGLVSP